MIHCYSEFRAYALIRQYLINKNSYQQVYIQACEKSYCYYIITMHVRELSKGVGPE